MFNRFNFDSTQFWEHVNLLILTLLFGTASYLYKLQKGTVIKTRVGYITEIFFSCSASYLAYRLGHYLDFKEDLLWLLVGVAAWSGTRFVNKLEIILDNYTAKKFNVALNTVTNEELENKELVVEKE